MDQTAIALCRENDLPIIVFDMNVRPEISVGSLRVMKWGRESEARGLGEATTRADGGCRKRQGSNRAIAFEDLALLESEAREGMEKALRSLRAELQKVRTGKRQRARCSTASQVDYYGTPTPLNQLANLSTPDPRLIVIVALRQGVSFQDIEKAILKPRISVSAPSNDGKVVRVPGAAAHRGAPQGAR